SGHAHRDPRESASNSNVEADESTRGYPVLPPEPPSPPRIQVDVFTNPVAMADFFERQMDDLWRSFGGLSGVFSELPPGSPGSPGFWAQPGVSPDSLEPYPRDEALGSREFMLKPGVGAPTLSPQDPRGFADQDLDHQVAEKGLAGIFEASPRRPEPDLNPFIFQGGQNSFSFSASSSQKSIRRPDGSMETTITQRDGRGQETTVITRQFGDKSHTVTTIKNSDGTEESSESFQNTDSEEMKRLQSAPSLGSGPMGHGHSSILDLFRDRVGPNDPNPPIMRPGPSLSDEESVFDRIFGRP
ncbi:hypothetical protein TCAL_15813, partial [Tigriopus californicus]